MIDGSEKRNGWLNFERQSLHVIERRSKRLSECKETIHGCFRRQMTKIKMGSNLKTSARCFQVLLSLTH